MTVKELIDALEQLDPDLPVAIPDTGQHWLVTEIHQMAARLSNVRDQPQMVVIRLS